MLTSQANAAVSSAPSRGFDGADPGSVVQRLDAQKDAIEAAARRELNKSGYGAMRGVQCVYGDGILVLRGRVPSYYLKQIAQACVLDKLEGIATIDNQLVVESANNSW